MKLSIILFAVFCIIAKSQGGELTPIQYAYSSFSPYALSYPHFNSFNPYFYSSLPSAKFSFLPTLTESLEVKVETPKEGELKKEDLKLLEPTIKYFQPGFPLTYRYVEPVPLANSIQYHSQDALGQYQYGYTNSQSAKSELKTFDGITRGGYSYVDAEGKLQSVSYVSDAINGFRVAATNLPKQLQPFEVPTLVESADVIEAKQQHFKAHQDALKLLKKSNEEAKETTE